MWSGRALVLLSLTSVVAALIAAIAAGWIYGLGLYVASVILLGLLLVRMIREQRRRSGRLPPSADLT
jgi:4-hydroxybenzoate polyprenyltransferase